MAYRPPGSMLRVCGILLVMSRKNPQITWRRLPTDEGRPELHIALSDALSRVVSVPSIWWHTTNRETLILGTGQPWSDVDIQKCRQQSVAVLKRKSGGTMVYAGPGVWGLDIAIPANAPEWRSDILEAYRWAGDIWVTALEILGIQARSVSIEEARAAASASSRCDALIRSICFATVSPYEVLVGTRKLVGFAQIRRKSSYVIQSGLYVRFPFERVASLVQTPDVDALASSLRERILGLVDLVPHNIGPRDAQRAFEEALAIHTNGRLVTGAWNPDETAQAAAAHLSFAPS